MKRLQAKDVDSYIAASDKAAQPIVSELRQIIKATVPEAEEGISWGVPIYKYHGVLAGFAVYKKHVSFGFGAGVLAAKEREMLEKAGYQLGKGTMQIKFTQKVPAAVVKKILKTKAKMNEAAQANK
jgi:uncharacterized protein YdhG (YjbR/CyaY superfamily)